MISKTGKRESSVSNKKVLIVSLEPFPFDNKLLMVELTSSVSSANAVCGSIKLLKRTAAMILISLPLIFILLASFSSNFRLGFVEPFRKIFASLHLGVF